MWSACIMGSLLSSLGNGWRVLITLRLHHWVNNWSQLQVNKPEELLDERDHCSRLANGKNRKVIDIRKARSDFTRIAIDFDRWSTAASFGASLAIHWDNQICSSYLIISRRRWISLNFGRFAADFQGLEEFSLSYCEIRSDRSKH